MNISYTPSPVAPKTTPTIKTMKVNTWYRGAKSCKDEYFYLTFPDNIVIRFGPLEGRLEAGVNNKDRWLESFELKELEPGEIKITVP